MKLTSFQKEIIDKIISKEVYDIYSFISVFLNVKPSYCSWTGTMGFVSINNVGKTNLQFDSKNALIFEKTEIGDVINKITSYAITHNFLANEELVLNIDILTRKFIPLLIDTDIKSNTINFNSPLDRINKLLLDCYLLEFLVTPELDEFKSRGYMTLSEFDIVEQNKDRKRSLRWTIVTAFTAIILSVSSIVLQIIFSGKERDVKITNDNAFPEAAKIILLNKVDSKDSIVNKNPVKKDTTKLK